jgi:hypothetical protein
MRTDIASPACHENHERLPHGEMTSAYPGEQTTSRNEREMFVGSFRLFSLFG